MSNDDAYKVVANFNLLVRYTDNPDTDRETIANEIIAKAEELAHALVAGNEITLGTPIKIVPERLPGSPLGGGLRLAQFPVTIWSPREAA